MSGTAPSTRRRPRSLRSRVAWPAAALVFTIGIGAGTAVTVGLWQRARADAPDRAASLAFDAAESSGRSVAAMTLPADRLALVVASDGSITVADGDVADRVVSQALDEGIIEEASRDFAAQSTLDIGAREWSFAAVSCANTKACDAILAGVGTQGLRDYLVERWYRVIGVALVLAAGAWVATRSVVGRSLRSVETMRSQLAEITASNLDRRIDVPTSGDEIEAVGHTLNETLERLERAVAANEQFVGDAAHELRSPLTGVRLALEVELASGPRPLLADALSEIDRATHLVDDLLVLARQAGAPTHREPIELRELVEEELMAFRGRFPEAAVTEQLANARIVADRESLRRAFRNLIDNAGFYGRGAMAVSMQLDAHGVRVDVDDNGPGIAARDRTRVFDRFTRLDSSRDRATGGTGLGLAIAREIVERHGGSLTIGDAPLGGARLSLALPL